MPGPPPPIAEALSSRVGAGRGGREDAIETLIDMALRIVMVRLLVLKSLLPYVFDCHTQFCLMSMLGRATEHRLHCSTACAGQWHDRHGLARSCSRLGKIRDPTRARGPRRAGLIPDMYGTESGKEIAAASIATMPEASTSTATLTETTDSSNRNRHGKVCSR